MTSSLLKSELDSKFCFCSDGVLRYLFVAWSGGQGIIILINHWARWTLPLYKIFLFFLSFWFFFNFCLFSLFSIPPPPFNFFWIRSMQGHVLVEVQALYWPLCVDISYHFHLAAYYDDLVVGQMMLAICVSVRKVKREKWNGKWTRVQVISCSLVMKSPHIILHQHLTFKIQ